jgi:hypothetical protein
VHSGTDLFAKIGTRRYSGLDVSNSGIYLAGRKLLSGMPRTGFWVLYQWPGIQYIQTFVHVDIVLFGLSPAFYHAFCNEITPILSR